MYQYLLTPKSQTEYEQSIEFYADRSEQATLNFINAVEQTLEQICKNPRENKKKYKSFCEIILEKYPFTIIYTIEEDIKLIIIISIYHHNRDPRYKYKAKKKK